MKLFIAQNIIVFIGYSFQDYDFQRTYKYISKNTGDFKRQAYIVTLDKSNEKNWLKYQLKPIYTEGSNFLRELKRVVEKKKCLLALKNMAKVLALQKYILSVHDGTSRKFKHSKFPDIIYCLSYQDGILHAFEYLTNKVKGGTSLCTGYLSDSIHAYEELVVRYKKNWLEHSYLEGYLAGIYLFNGAMFTDIKLRDIPIFCYYNEVGAEKFMSEREFAASLIGRHETH